MEALGQLVRFAKELLTLKGQVEKNTLDIKDIREDLKLLTTAIQDLKYEMQNFNHVVEVHQLKTEHELKTQRLELENAVLRHFRLPSSNDVPPTLPPSE